jgi:hypothetical protein
MGMTLTKEQVRSRERVTAAEERERIAMRMWLEGRTQAEIGKAIDRHQASVSRIIQTGMARRAAEDAPTVEAARALYLDRLHALFGAWWPLATGAYFAEEGDPPLPPDPKAGELVLKIMDRIAMASGKVIAPEGRNENNLHLHVHTDGAREQILGNLATMAAKMHQVDGELADVGTSVDLLSGKTIIDSKPAPPPVAKKDR